MKIYEFSIEGVGRIPEIGMIYGIVSIGLSNEDEGETGNRLTMSVRIKENDGDTFQALETNLLRRAAETCRALLPLLESETPESLRRRVERF